MIRLWMIIGTGIAALALIGTIYGKGYFSCKQDIKSEQDEQLIERNRNVDEVEKRYVEEMLKLLEAPEDNSPVGNITSRAIDSLPTSHR